MEDDQVYLENDPLARYFKSIKEPFYEEPALGSQKHAVKKISLSDTSLDSNMYDYECQQYVEFILKSELLFCEDSNLLQSLIIYKKQNSNKFKNIILYTILPAVTGTIMVKYNAAPLKYLSCALLLPTIGEGHKLFIKYLNRRKIEKYINLSKLFTNTTKVCVNLFHEYIVTLNYFTTVRQNRFHLVINKFADLVLKTIYNISTYLQQESVTIKNFVSINEDVFYLEDVADPPCYVDTDYSSMKMYREYYLLIQSHYLKLLGLIFTPNIWKAKPNLKKIFESIVDVSDILEKSVKKLRLGYNSLKNYGVTDTIRPKTELIKQAYANCIITDLFQTEIYMHHLLIQIRDSRTLLNKVNIQTKSPEKDYNDLINLLKGIDNEMSKTVQNFQYSIKSLLNDVESKTDVKNSLQQPIQQVVEVNRNNESDNQVNEHEAEKKVQVWELYIPKDEVLQEDEHCLERDIASTLKSDYSGPLLEELRMILKNRNPDIFNEQQELRDEEPEEVYTRRDIFIPQAAVGFTTNVLSDLFAARNKMMQHNEEEFGNDTEDDNEEDEDSFENSEDDIENDSEDNTGDDVDGYEDESYEDEYDE